jgi:hypothetical protein|nr:MAG TPA: hypothetical protein [Caudoviricetes sp.]
MDTNNLMFDGEKIDLERIKKCHKKYDMFPTPWGNMTLWYLTYRIDYLTEQTQVSPMVEVRPYLYKIIDTMKAIKAYLEKE